MAHEELIQQLADYILRDVDLHKLVVERATTLLVREQNLNAESRRMMSDYVVPAIRGEIRAEVRSRLEAEDVVGQTLGALDMRSIVEQAISGVIQYEVRRLPLADMISASLDRAIRGALVANADAIRQLLVSSLDDCEG
jgi:hypothetical protein